jgi:parallel beta-helix repeat protein
MKQTTSTSSQFNPRQSTGYSLFILILTLLILSGCKKDDSEFKHTKQSIIKNLLKNAEKNPTYIVHAGSSIQAAIDAASPYSVIKIEPGVYKEALVIAKKGIVLIGANEGSKLEVVIENPGDEENGITVTENDFVLKNVTVKDFEENGVFLSGVNGFLLSHVTTIDNGEYGLFPIHSTNGLIEHCFASRHTDTGIYVGQSTDVDINQSSATANVNGIEIENCSMVSASKNKCYDNVAGILVVLLPNLSVKTSSDILVSNNHVYENNHKNFADPEDGFEAVVPSGSGILIIGTDNTIVRDNHVSDNNFVGIATVSTVIIGSLAGLPPSAFSDIEPNPDGTQVLSNMLKNNGSAPPPNMPLPGVDLLWDGSGTNNCWSNNKYNTSYPATLPSCN